MAKTTPEAATTIEGLKVKKGTPDAVYHGMCAAQGWKPGKMVTEQNYDKAAVAFLSSPIGGRKK